MLAVDWGERRIGLSLSDESQRLAQPLTTLTRRAGKRFPMHQLRTLLEQHAVAGVIVGLPLDEQGEEGAPARAARRPGGARGTSTRWPRRCCCSTIWMRGGGGRRDGVRSAECGVRNGRGGSDPP